MHLPVSFLNCRRSFNLTTAMSQTPNTVLRSSQQILRNYPVPLSPPLPAISKDVELARAMSASSRSSTFSPSKSQVIYEDRWLIAVNKPMGVYCDALLGSVSASAQDPCSTKETGSTLKELHLANRLDRDTSGVMLITKSHKGAAKLVKAFTDHKVRKTYVALCVGSSPKWKNITIRSGHGRSRFGAWRVYAASDVGKSLPGGSSVRSMETTFELLSVNGEKPEKSRGSSDIHGSEGNLIIVEEKSEIDDEKEDEIVVRAFPRSGRTHQIRLHCQYLGISIKGDVKYDGVHEWKGEMLNGHLLHAESLSFEHPVTGLPLHITSPLPSWATEALKE